MDKLVDTQCEQVESFKSSVKYVKQDIMREVNWKIGKVREEVYRQSLKSQAFNNRRNLIIVGLAEDENKSALSQANDFFLKL